MPHILFVDDEEPVRQNYELLLRHHGYQVTSVASVDQAIEELRNGTFDLIITDMRMYPKTGMDLLRSAKQAAPETGIIVLTGHAEMQNAIEAMKFGAVDYITKETDHREILLTVQKAIDTAMLRAEVQRLRTQLQGKYSAESMIGTSRQIREVLERVRRVAPTESRVLITGESGTGKELAAQMIHHLSERAMRPFVAINCGAIPKDLQESELFGHVRGAYTNADRDRKGLLETASTGTLFLDEVGEMSPATQVKLLRFLETQEYFPVGSSTARSANVRVVAATNRDLASLVRTNLFREDLYYRLKVVEIHLPPLRERRADIPLIAEQLLLQLNRRTRTAITTIEAEVKQALMEYDWPGNVRELKNILERALIFSNSGVIDLESLPEELFHAKPIAGVTGSERSGILPLDAVEREHILKTLALNHGNKLLTAQQLNIATTTLYRKLRQYKIE